MFIRHNEHPIDKVFRQKLHDAEEEVPVHLWEGIRKKKSGRKRFYLFLLMGAAMLCGVVVTSIYFIGSETSPVSAASAPAPAANNDPKQQDREERTAASVESNDASNEPSALSPVEEGSPAVERNSIEDKQADAATKKDNVLKPQEQKRKSERRGNREATKYAGKTPAPRNYPPAIFDSRDDQKKPEKNEDPVFLSSVTRPVEGEQGQQQILEPVGQQSEHAGPGLSDDTRIALEDEVLEKENLPFLKPEPYAVPVKRFEWFVGAYGALAKPLHVKTAGASDEAFDALVARTHSGIVKSLGFNAGLRTSFGLSFSTGVELAVFDEKHSWVDTSGYNGAYVTYDYQIVYPDPEGIPVIQMVADTNWSQDYSLVQKSHINKYTSLNLPLLFGYTREAGQWSYGLTFGPVWKMRRIYDGSFVFPRSDGPPVSSSFVTDVNPTSAEDVYVNVGEYYTRWKMDLHLGFDVGYRFSTAWSVQAAAIYRWMPRPITDVKALSHRIDQPGVSLGLRYHF